RDGTATRAAFEAPIAAAFGRDGRLLVSGEHERLAFVSEAKVDPLPPPETDVRAIASEGDAWLALVDDKVARFDGATWTDVHYDAAGSFLAAREDGKAFAVTTSPLAVECIGDGACRTSYGETYSEPKEDISITGLAFLSGGRVVIALDRGRANIVFPDGALK